MKYILTFLLTCIAITTNATNYFVSAAGNNSNNGTTTSTTWLSITKVNSFTYAAAGDTVKFNRGDKYYGALVCKKNVVYTFYGTGADPEITGLTTATSWVNDGGGIYYVNAPDTKGNLNLVLVNGSPVGRGRFPNATAANGGYLTYETVFTKNSVSDNELAATPNWAGADIYIRENQWSTNRARITGHTGNLLNYATGININQPYGAKVFMPTPKYGYYITNDKRTLDLLHEWYLDSVTHRLYMFFGAANPNSYAIQYSSIDTGAYIPSTANGVTISGLAFTGFHRGIYSFYSTNTTILNCPVTNIGAYGVQLHNCTNVLVDGVTATDCMSSGIVTYSLGKTNITIQNCTTTRTGMITGMGANFAESDLCGIFCAVTNTAVIKNNRVSYSGGCGIYFGGNNVTVEGNVVLYCVNEVQDRANIYCFDDYNATGTSTGTTIKNNICGFSNGAPLGTNQPTTPFCALIYLDGKKSNVQVLNNTIYNGAKNGIHCNNPANVRISNTTCWNTPRPLSFFEWNWSEINKISIANNFLLQFNPSNTLFAYGKQLTIATTLPAELATIGYSDSNTIYTAPATGYQFATSPAQSSMNYATWQAQTGFDAHSTSLPLLPTYNLKKLVTATLTTNGTFTSNITGWSRAGSGSTAWDAGRLRFTFTAPKPNQFSLIYGSVGTVTNGKRYIARVTLQGSNSNGSVRVYLRRTASPGNTITDTATASYNSTSGVKEFLVSPTTTAAASIVVAMEQNGGTTWIDNVMLYEADATVLDPRALLRFEVNETTTTKNIDLSDGTYVDFATGLSVASLALPAKSSRILKRISSTSSSIPATGTSGTPTTTASQGAAVLFLNH